LRISIEVIERISSQLLFILVLILHFVNPEDEFLIAIAPNLLSFILGLRVEKSKHKIEKLEEELTDSK